EAIKHSIAALLPRDEADSILTVQEKIERYFFDPDYKGKPPADEFFKDEWQKAIKHWDETVLYSKNLVSYIARVISGQQPVLIDGSMSPENFALLFSESIANILYRYRALREQQGSGPIAVDTLLESYALVDIIRQAINNSNHYHLRELSVDLLTQLIDRGLFQEEAFDEFMNSIAILDTKEFIALVAEIGPENFLKLLVQGRHYITTERIYDQNIISFFNRAMAVLRHEKVKFDEMAIPVLPLATILPQYAGKYLNAQYEGWSRSLALLVKVLLPKQWRIMLQPRKFDLMHGFPDQSHTNSIQRAFLISWGAAVVGLAGLVFMLGLELPLLAAGGLAIGLLSGGITAVLRMSVLFSRKAALPPVFLVSTDGYGLGLDVAAKKVLDNQDVPIKVLWRKPGTELSGAAPRSMGVKGVYTRIEDKILAVYIDAETAEEFAQNTADVVSALKGYANVQGAAYPMKVLSEVGGVNLDNNKIIVIDYTGRMPIKGWMYDDIEVLSDTSKLAAWEPMRNAHNADLYASEPEIVIQGMNATNLKGIKHINQSVGFSQENPLPKDSEIVRKWKDEGARVYFEYDGDSVAEAERLIMYYGLNGIVFLNDNVSVAAIARRHPGVVVAGGKDAPRPYVELSLNVDIPELAAQVKKVNPGSIIKVHGKYTAEKIRVLNSLPSSSILVINGKEFRRESMEPDMTDPLGVYLLFLLHLTPQTREQKAEHERKVAGFIKMGDNFFNEYKSDDEYSKDLKRLASGLQNVANLTEFIRNSTVYEAIRLHAIGVSDLQSRESFLKAMIDRLQARYLLAQAPTSKKKGLENIDLEMWLGEMMTRQGVLGPDKLVLAEFDRMALRLNPVQVQGELIRMVTELKLMIDGDGAHAYTITVNGQSIVIVGSQAAATAIQLILLYANERFSIQIVEEYNTPLRMDATKAMLEA
ncbi:MAG: hypothetical protein ABSH12_09780, partial [Endomicrobiales bacterium]